MRRLVHTAQGVSQTSMEDVFLQIVQLAEQQDTIVTGVPAADQPIAAPK